MEETKLEVRALDERYFDEAESNEHTYGTINKYVNNRWAKFYVYVWLGQEVSYKRGTDSRTKYKKFVDCTIAVAKTQELLDEGNSPQKDGVTIILFW